MRRAADEIGWEPSDGALRTLASEYRKVGYFIGVSHGVVKLNPDRIVTALGPIFDDEKPVGSHASDGSRDQQDFDTIEAADAEGPGRQREDDIYEDDDVPF